MMMWSHGMRAGLVLGLMGLVACDAEQLSFGVAHEAGSTDGDRSDQTGTAGPEEGGASPEPDDAGSSDAPETESDDPPDAGEPDDTTDTTDTTDDSDDTTDADPVATCEEDEDCDDGNVCNGVELCMDGECSSDDWASNGTVCQLGNLAIALLCRDGNCALSECGDGILDERNDEECDDGNGVDGDGCDVGCTYSCSSNENCDDSNVCNGEERCDQALHACVAGDRAEDGTSCGDNRECNSGRCIQIGCGNDTLEEELGEVCDDGNLVDGDGCDSDCTWTCTTDDECNDGNLCNGTETCDPVRHICSPGASLECDDQSQCTQNICDPLEGCVYPLIDADGDGYASVELGACGNDCNDTDGTIYPGAAELCDGKDNDCNGKVDDEAPYWYVDCDGDGFAVEGDPGVQGCTMPASPRGCPSGLVTTWTTTAPTTPGNTDCYDGNASMRPRVGADNDAAWSTTGDNGRPAGQRFDYNCSSADESRYTKAGVSPTGGCTVIIYNPPVGPIGPIGPIASIELTLNPQQVINPTLPIGVFGTECGNNNGWTGSTAPACGTSAEFSRCLKYGDGPCERANPISRTQQCR